MEPRTFLRLVCVLLVSNVIFGAAVGLVLATPGLKEQADYFIPVAMIFTVALAPPLANIVAGRMRIRNWGRKAWQKGDFISG